MQSSGRTGWILMLATALVAGVAAPATAEQYELGGVITVFEDPDGRFPGVLVGQPVTIGIGIVRNTISPYGLPLHPFSISFLHGTPNERTVVLSGGGSPLGPAVYGTASSFSGIHAAGRTEETSPQLELKVDFAGPAGTLVNDAVPELAFGGWQVIRFKLRECDLFEGCGGGSDSGKVVVSGFIHSITPLSTGGASLTALVNMRASQASVDALAGAVAQLQADHVVINEKLDAIIAELSKKK